MTSRPDNPLGDLFADIMDDAIAHILAHEDAEAFQNWFMQTVHEYSADPDIRPLASAMGRAIWNATPLPGNDFRPRILPSPGRNDPCPCNSGRKFKRCCGAGPPAPSLDQQMFWPYVVHRLSKSKRDAAIAEGKIPIDVLMGAAVESQEAGRPKTALKFLEPLFAGEIRRTDEDHDYALNLLCNLYDALGYSKKKSTLLKRVTEEVKRSPLRSGAWQRLATMSMDAGDPKTSWDYFKTAQRDDPGSTSIGILEIQLLMGEGKTTLASERARFWVKRLQREGWPGDSEPMLLLKAVARDAEMGMAQVGIDIAGGAGQRLLEWFGEVGRRDVPDYKVLGDANETEFFVPPETIAALEDPWHEIFPADKPFSVNMTNGDASVWDPDIEDAWMHFLESHPEAFDSIDILDDIAGAVVNHAQWNIPGVDEKLLAPVLDRAESIIEKALTHSSDTKIVWMYPDNRPALRCLVHLIFLQQRRGNDDAANDLAQKVLSLNPNDNHGFRTTVINARLRRGDDAAALALAEQYPADLNPDISYGKVLALYRLERLEEASDALSDAIADLPKIPRFLSAKRIRKPKIDDFGVKLGGDDQAWQYREEMRDIWSATPGALDWLKRQ